MPKKNDLSALRAVAKIARFQALTGNSEDFLSRLSSFQVENDPVCKLTGDASGGTVEEPSYTMLRGFHKGFRRFQIAETRSNNRLEGQIPARLNTPEAPEPVVFEPRGIRCLTKKLPQRSALCNCYWV
jgi:hypothetical protein